MAGKRKDTKGRVLKMGETQRSNGTYEYRWKDNKRKSHSIYSKTLDELRKKEAEINRDIADGIDFSAGYETVSQLVDRYMALKSVKLKENSRRAYGSAVNRIKGSSFGKKAIRTIKKSDAQIWFVSLHKKGLARNTIQIIKNILQPAFEMALDDDAIRKNPFTFHLSDLLPDDAVYRDALTESQQEHYLRFIKEYGNGNYYDDIVILVETGLRISELYGLTKADVDLCNRRIYVRRQLCRTAEKPYFITAPKSTSGIRTVPMSDRALTAFRHVLSNRPSCAVEMMIDGITGFIFLDKDNNPKVSMHCQNYMRKMQAKYRKIYGTRMPTVTPHILRHTFCTRMAQRELDPKSLQYVMGHSKPDITLGLYTHADYDYVEHAFYEALQRKVALL